MPSVQLHLGDALQILPTLPENSIDAIVTDPPAGISFMNREWDKDKGGRRQWIAWMAEVAEQCLRVIRPGGHAFVWALPKTAHWTTTAWEDAGWEVREKFYHLFGQGFPKSSNVSRDLLELPWCSCGHVASAGTKDTSVVDKALATSGTGLELGSSVEFARSQFGGGKVALAGAELATIGNEGDAAAGADVGVALGSSRGDSLSLVEGSTLPAQDISARVRASGTPGFARGLAANDAEGNGGGLESSGSAGHRSSTVEGRIENIVGQLAPVMLWPFDMAGMATSDEIAGNVGGIQDQPEALRNNMVGDQVGGTATVNTSPVPGDNGLRDVVPSASLVGPLTTAPSGISGPASTAFVVDSHARATAIDRGLDSLGDTSVEVGAAHNASEGLSAASEFTTPGTLEQNRLNGSAAASGAVFSGVPPSVELDSAVLASFGRHGHIIRQLVTERKVSVCADCGKPMCPEWIIDGLGTATKPAAEEWILLRKPLSEPTIAANVLRWGTGALAIDKCRIETDEETGRKNKRGPYESERTWSTSKTGPQDSTGHGLGRWPANLCLSDDAAALLDEMSGERKVGVAVRHNKGVTPSTFLHHDDRQPKPDMGYGDVGGASRFFLRVAPDADEPLRMMYVPKASKRDRDEGLEGMPEKPSKSTGWSGDSMPARNDTRPGRTVQERPEPMARNVHPCVKPTALCRWLVRLVTPPGGTVLDPFMGSGSTLKAAVLEGFNGIGIEMDEEYLAIAEKRIEFARQQVAQMPLDIYNGALS